MNFNCPKPSQQSVACTNTMQEQHRSKYISASTRALSSGRFIIHECFLYIEQSPTSTNFQHRSGLLLSISLETTEDATRLLVFPKNSLPLLLATHFKIGIKIVRANQEAYKRNVSKRFGRERSCRVPSTQFYSPSQYPVTGSVSGFVLAEILYAHNSFEKARKRFLSAIWTPGQKRRPVP